MKRKIIFTLFIVILSVMGYTQNYSLQFDGIDDYVNTQIISSEIIENNEISLSAWVYLTDNDSEFGRTILSNFYPSNTTIWFGIGGNSADMIDMYNKPVIGYVAESELLVYMPLDSYTIAYCTWTHIAVTLTTTSINWYINGEYKETVNIDIGSFSSEGNPPEVKIGQGNPTTNFRQDWKGYLDDVILSNEVISSNDILKLYMRSYSGLTSSYIGIWNFNEGLGPTAYDSTSNGNDGTITGATWSTDKIVLPNSLSLSVK